MRQWRLRTAQAMAKVKVPATVTMAIVKLKMQWGRDRRARQHLAHRNIRSAWAQMRAGSTAGVHNGAQHGCHTGKASEAASRITATMRMVTEVSTAKALKQARRHDYERLTATFAMVEVRRAIRCVHNRGVEALKKEVIKRHWDLYVAGKVSQEWAAQPYWRQQSAGSRLCSHVVGAAVRKRMRHGAAQAMHTALQFLKGTHAGRRERSLYRAVAAMIMHKKRSRQLWGTPTKLSALYRIWRQVLEDSMHKCITLWMVNQLADTAEARAFKFFYMGQVITGVQQVSWFYMGKALTSVLAGGVLRAISRWQYNMSRFWVENPAWKHRKKCRFFT